MSLSYTVPTPGSTLNSVADPEVASALNAILTWANGNIGVADIAAALAQSAGVNQAGQVTKGSVSIPTSQSTSSTSFTTLTTPDQVAGIVGSANSLIRVWYQAIWQESVSGAARAAIFLDGNELISLGTVVTLGEAFISQTAGQTYALTSWPLGLASASGSGAGPLVNSGNSFAIGGAMVASGSLQNGGTFMRVGGPCDVAVPAGTHTVSVQFKASSGSVTVQNRWLYVQALSFS